MNNSDESPNEPYEYERELTTDDQGKVFLSGTGARGDGRGRGSGIETGGSTVFVLDWSLYDNSLGRWLIAAELWQRRRKSRRKHRRRERRPCFGELVQLDGSHHDWFEGRRRRQDTEPRMTAVLDELGLTALVTSIQGLSAVGAAGILARM